MTLRIILLIATGFILGAVPFSWLIGTARGVDLRKTGSHNIGATNLMRTCGKGPGFAGLFLDVLKGAVPVVLAIITVGRDQVLLQSAVATAAVLGHMYTPFLGFAGGKGVATALGALMALAPVPSMAALAVFLLVLLLSGIVSLSSILAVAALVPAVFLFRGGSENLPVQVACCVMALLVIQRHRTNISRLFRGEENRLLGKRRDR
jgi:glycerol-3-phosphate acyltransferase PlsY